jgi:hypothetical protein
MPRHLARSPVNIPDSVHPLLLPERRAGLRGHARRDRSDRQGAVGSDGPAPEPRAGVRAVTARERGGPAWSGRRPGVRDADAHYVISVTRRYAVGRRGALSRGSRPHTSHWGPYRCCPRTMFITRAAEPQRIRRRGSSNLLAITSTCFPVRRPRRRPAPTVTSRRPARVIGRSPCTGS